MKRMLFFVIFALLPSIALPDQVTEKQIAIKEMMEVSGINHFINNIAEMNDSIISSLEKQNDNLDKDFFKNFSESLKKNLAPQDILIYVENSFSEELAMDEIKFVTDFYLSEFGKKVLELENKFQSPTEQENIQRNIADILVSLESVPERKSLIFQLRDGLKIDEMSARSLRSYMYAIFVGMVGTGKLPAELTDEQIEKIVENALPDALERSKSTSIASFYKTYETLSNEELKNYFNVISNDMRNLYEVFTGSLRVIISKKLLNFGDEFLKSIGKRKI